MDKLKLKGGISNAHFMANAVLWGGGAGLLIGFFAGSFEVMLLFFLGVPGLAALCLLLISKGANAGAGRLFFGGGGQALPGYSEMRGMAKRGLRKEAVADLLEAAKLDSRDLPLQLALSVAMETPVMAAQAAKALQGLLRRKDLSAQERDRLQAMLTGLEI